jgi:hypothetical protein
MGKVLGLFVWLKARLLEPSTHASLAAVLAMVGIQLDHGMVQDWLNVLTLVFGSLGFFVKEQAALTKL